MDDTLNENCDIPEWVNKIILSNEKSDYLECINIESEIQKLNERKNQIQLNLNITGGQLQNTSVETVCKLLRNYVSVILHENTF